MSFSSMTSGPPSQPTSPTSVPTPSSVLGSEPTPTDAEMDFSGTDASSALGVAINESVLTYIESGAAHLLSTAVSDGLSNPFDSVQTSWVVGPQDVGGALSQFTGQVVDSYTNPPSGDPNTGLRTGGAAAIAFSGAQNFAPDDGDSTSLPTSSATSTAPVRTELGKTSIDGIEVAVARVIVDGVVYMEYYNDTAKFYKRVEIGPVQQAPSVSGQTTQSPIAPVPPPPPVNQQPIQPAAPPLPQNAAAPDWTTVTEWAFPPGDPRLIQPTTHLDTGYKPLNFVLNKVLVPWVNLLGAVENIPLALVIGVDDTMRHSPFSMEWQAAQDMMPLEGAAMEVGPALEYAKTWLSTQDFQSHVTAPVFWFMGAGGIGGGAGVPKMTSLPSSTPSAGAILQANRLRGNAFQSAVTTTFGLPSNTAKGNAAVLLGQTRSGALWPTIPDVYAGGQTPIGDVKDVINLSYTRQLQAQADVAKSTGTSFNVITSPRTRTISQPLMDAVQSSGGFIFKVDPAAGSVHVWDVSAGAWVPFF
ncbi:putative toxin [Paraburkholderia sp. J7]|uniref:putative toxin n=1 Tax=Paraburkholderia sp. J7 TaxID=2805438 RepID=UPI002AB65249|nr:putative toxin [Paraburkholderia sp. J7]